MTLHVSFLYLIVENDRYKIGILEQEEGWRGEVARSVHLEAQTLSVRAASGASRHTLIGISVDALEHPKLTVRISVILNLPESGLRRLVLTHHILPSKTPQRWSQYETIPLLHPNQYGVID
jgi:hypothetical protein